MANLGWWVFLVICFMYDCLFIHLYYRHTIIYYSYQCVCYLEDARRREKLTRVIVHGWQGRHDPLNNAPLRAEHLKALCPHVRVEMVDAGKGVWCERWEVR